MTQTIEFNANNEPLKKANKENIEGANAHTASLKRTTKESQELNRIVTKGAREAESATQKWQRQTDLLNKSFKQGKISQKELADGQAHVNRELQKSEQSADSFGSKLIGSLQGATAGLVGVGAALGILRTGFQAVREEAERLADSTRDSVDAFAELAQVSTSQGDNAILVKGARDLRAAGATSSLEAAGRAAFSIRSAGLESDLPTFSKIGAAGLVADLGGLAKSVATVRNAFGAADAGDTQTIASQGLAASGVSPENLNQILEATARTGQIARTIGIKTEEALSAVSLISSQTGSAAEAATQVRAFFGELEKRKITTGTLQERVEGIAAREAAGESLSDIIGDSIEAKGGYRALANSLVPYAANLANIDKAGDGSQLAASLTFARNDPVVDAALTRRQAEGAEEVGQLLIGAQENFRRATLDQLDLVQTDRGLGGFSRGIGQSISGGLSLTGGGVIDPNDPLLLAEREEARRTGDTQRAGNIDKLIELNAKLLDVQKQIRDQGNARVPVVPTPEAN